MFCLCRLHTRKAYCDCLLRGGAVAVALCGTRSRDGRVNKIRGEGASELERVNLPMARWC